jgi:cyclophilin family peptidyl-prolyl cis-trans isomerase
MRAAAPFLLLLLAGAGAAQAPEEVPEAELGILAREWCRAEDRTGMETLWAEASDPVGRARLLRAMGRIGGPGLHALVVELLGAARAPLDPAEAQGFAEAVAGLGDPELLPGLERVAGPLAAAWALQVIGAWPAGDRGPAFWDRLVAAAGATSASEELVTAILLAAARLEDPRTSTFAQERLQRGLGPEAARAAAWVLARHPVPAGEATIPALLRLLVAVDEETRGLAATALGRAEVEGEDPVLILAALLDEEAPRSLAVPALRGLAVRPRAAVLPALFAPIRSDDWQVRRAAFEAVAALGPGLERTDRSGLAALAMAAACDDPEPDVARAAVLAWGALDPDALWRLRARFQLAGAWSARAAAVAVFAKQAEGATWPWLAGRLAQDPDRRVRMAVLEGLAARAGTLPSPHLPAGWGPALGLEPEPGGGAWILRIGDDPDEVLDLLRVQAVHAWWKRVRTGSARLEIRVRNGRRSELPLQELEPALGLLELAADAGDVALLEAYARFGRIPLRRRACELGRRLGVALPPPERPPDPLAAREEVEDLLRERAGEATVVTSRGELRLRLLGDEAPLTVATFCRHARRGAFAGVLWHRVVPGFVAQTGCPRGDGYGEPGGVLPCELGARRYRRGSVGMALAGRDTGGSQWFLTHVATPHLDGRFTLFAELVEGGEVLDALRPGDWIEEVRLHSASR